jgi:hypothetical protein
MMVGGAQRIIEHPYIDPTGSKPSEMLMVWAHTAAERVAQVVDGVYTLEVEQLHDLQNWCAPLCGPPSAARSHIAHNTTTHNFHKMEVAPVQSKSSEDEDEAAPRSAKRKVVESGGTRGRGRGRGRGRRRGRGPATAVRPPPMLTTATNDATEGEQTARWSRAKRRARTPAWLPHAPPAWCHVRACGAQDMTCCDMTCCRSWPRRRLAHCITHASSHVVLRSSAPVFCNPVILTRIGNPGAY